MIKPTTGPMSFHRTANGECTFCGVQAGTTRCKTLVNKGTALKRDQRECSIQEPVEGQKVCAHRIYRDCWTDHMVVTVIGQIPHKYTDLSCCVCGYDCRLKSIMDLLIVVSRESRALQLEVEERSCQRLQTRLNTLPHALVPCLPVPLLQQLRPKFVRHLAQILAFVLRWGSDRLAIWPKLSENCDHLREGERSVEGEDTFVLHRWIQSGGDEMDAGVVFDVDMILCGFVSVRNEMEAR